MSQWDAELGERIERFQKETGLTEEQLIKATDDAPPYPEGYIDDLISDGINPEKHREETLRANMEAIVTDTSIEAIKTLQEKVGFSTDEIAVMLDKSYDAGESLLEAMTDDVSIRDIELLTKVAEVPTSEIVDLLKGKNPDDRHALVTEGGLADMVSDNFPDSDWGKHEDVDTSKLDFDDPVMLDIVGEPKGRGFTEQLAEKENSSRDDDKQR